MDMDLFIDLLRSDGSIIVNKRLSKKIGLNEAILYSELVSKYKYFKNKDQLTPDGYFFNTVDNLEDDTCLSGKQQRPCIKKLEKLNLIEMKVQGLPSKRYFKINLDIQPLLRCLSNEENQQECPKGIPSRAQNDSIEVPKGNANNTKLNNTIKNNNKKDKASSLPNDGINFVDNFSEDALSVYQYFISRYEDTKKEVHPTINKNVIHILNNMMEYECIYDRECDRELTIDIGTIYLMIDEYFIRDYDLPSGGQSDHRIYHFLCDNILKNLYYKVAY